VEPVKSRPNFSSPERKKKSIEEDYVIKTPEEKP
jgi:hypothetical protein